MNENRKYRIPFVGLKNGRHEFHYDIQDSFFEEFGMTDGRGANIQVDLGFDKRDDFFILDFYVHGHMMAECDRCLEKLDLEILDEHKVYVKFDDEAKSNGANEEDIIYISRNDFYIDVKQLVYEFINLSIPVQKICPPKGDGVPGCNKKVLQILDARPEKQEKIDPRWEALKKLK